MDLNTLLNARYNKGARSLFGLEEQEGLTTVSPELQLVSVLEGPNLEYRFNLNELCFGRGLSLAAQGAAAISSWILRNPSGSGVLAVVEEVGVASGTTGEIQIGVLGDPVTDLATTVQSVVRDTRALVSRLSTCIVSAGAGAFGGSAQWRALGLANTMNFARVGWVLRPGDGLQVSAVTDNVTLVGHFAWRERPHRPGELVG